LFIADVDLRAILLSAVVGPIVGFILGVAVARSRQAVLRRFNFLRRCLPLRVRRVSREKPRIRQDPIAIAYGLIPPSENRLPYYMVEEGDVVALDSVTTLLSALYGRRNVYAENHHDIQSELARIRNLVTLSGPVWNAVTELYLGLLGCPVTFDLTAPELRLAVLNKDRGVTRYIESTYARSGRPKHCYGTLACGSLMLPGAHHKQHVVLVGGNSNLSTYAGALFLAAMHDDRSLRRKLKGHGLARAKRWQIVYSVQNWSEDTSWYSDIPPIKIGVLRLGVEAVWFDRDFLAPYEYHLPRSATS
jgi:hypothetical protein